MAKKFNLMKVASIIVPIVGAGIGLASNWLEDKKLEDKVGEKVAEALAKSNEKN